jgi:hypothetical protein
MVVYRTSLPTACLQAVQSIQASVYEIQMHAPAFEISGRGEKIFLFEYLDQNMEADVRGFQGAIWLLV